MFPSSGEQMEEESLCSLDSVRKAAKSKSLGKAI